MLLGIDHLVIVVNDLERAARDYEQLGFTVVPGGKHPVGSHNVLIAFADGSYLEIIAFYREARDHRWWEPLQKGERLVDVCMQTDDLPGDTRKLRAAGVAINDPVPWSRTRPDGYELKWVLSLAQGTHRGVAPFLIQDTTPRQERIPQRFEHANGATGIAGLMVAVEELSGARRWYGGGLGCAGDAITDRTLGADGIRYNIGTHRVDFLMPADSRSPLASWLQTFGPSPYAATFRSASKKPPPLDPKLSHGANLSFVH
jgi:catechol 2,3-dioxygenase-like lactoylglutathione lyase family enzyme